MGNMVSGIWFRTWEKYIKGSGIQARLVREMDRLSRLELIWSELEVSCHLIFMLFILTYVIV